MSRPRLILFVTGDAPRSERARRNLDRALHEVGADAGRVEEIDLVERPEETVEFGVYATPALVAVPERGARSVLYGDLSETAALRRFLEESGAPEEAV